MSFQTTSGEKKKKFWQLLSVLFWPATNAAKPINQACTAIFLLMLSGFSTVNLSLLLHSAVASAGGTDKTQYKASDLYRELGSSYSTVNKLLEDVLWFSFAQDTSLCAPRLFHAASQSIAKGDKNICFEGTLLAQTEPVTRLYPEEIL